MLTTRFTERFGVDHPILSAPVGGATDSRLAAAVSAAGALGTFQAWHPTLGLEWLVEQITAVRAATARPFGVGFIVAFIFGYSSFGNFGILARERSQMLPMLLVGTFSIKSANNSVLELSLSGSSRGTLRATS